MRRVELQVVSNTKIDDATHLLVGGRYANAYYLAGYAVEIGLKACIARRFVADEIPDKRFVLSIFDHDLTKLVGVAGLAAELRERRLASGEFDANWGIASEWRAECRYESVDEESARLLVSAIAERHHGVLKWIRHYW